MSSRSHSLAIVQQFYPQVEKVIAAKKPIFVTVKASDGKGKQRQHNACAMAAACERELGLKAIFSRSIAYLVKDTTATKYIVNGAAREEIIAFDRSGVITPGTYKLYPSFRPQRPKGNNGKATGVNRRARKEITGLRAAL